MAYDRAAAANIHSAHSEKAFHRYAILLGAGIVARRSADAVLLSSIPKCYPRNRKLRRSKGKAGKKRMKADGFGWKCPRRPSWRCLS